jgi:biotin synthase
MKKTSEMLGNSSLSREDLVYLLNLEGEEMTGLFNKANEIKERYCGNKIFFRGLIEFSNACEKDCLYCGIRKSNRSVRRYTMTDQEILESARFALENHIGSIVLQSGEITSKAFAKRIEKLLFQIKSLSETQLGITLSLGEQEPDVYRRWFEAGAHRYLLRIETRSEELFHKIHPNDSKHDFKHRLDSLYSLREIGYQTGTGVMIGLPFQTVEDLASDLLFFKDFDVDMVGMGPYIEHSETPLFQFRNQLLSLQKRFSLSLKMISILRILMKDINIAAATALQVIDPFGRIKAMDAGANIIMPDITPVKYREKYKLYENKPFLQLETDEYIRSLESDLVRAGKVIGFDEWGDSGHFFTREINNENDINRIF